MFNTLALLGASAICALGGLSYGAPSRANSTALYNKTGSVSLKTGADCTFTKARTSVRADNEFFNYIDTYTVGSSSFVYTDPAFGPLVGGGGLLTLAFCVPHFSPSQSSVNVSVLLLWSAPSSFNQGTIRYDFYNGALRGVQSPYNRFCLFPKGAGGLDPFVIDSGWHLYRENLGYITNPTISPGTFYVSYDYYSGGYSPGTSASPNVLLSSSIDYFRQYVTFNYSFNVVDFSSYEFIDIWSLMSAVLTMPFTFLTSFWTHPIFEGTPFAFVPSTLIYSLFAITLIYAIVKLIMGIVK